MSNFDAADWMTWAMSRTSLRRTSGAPPWSNVVHACDLQPFPYTDSPVVHVVLSRRPLGTPLTDLRDAGHTVTATRLFPAELRACPDIGQFDACQHLLVRPPETDGKTETLPLRSKETVK